MGHTVLIIDDSETIRQHVTEALGPVGLFENLLQAGDGMEGFKILVTHPVDLILCDVVMPGFDGFKFLTLKNSKEEFGEIPVIMLTGQDDIETKVRCLTSGAADYITKPFHDEELLARVRVHTKIKFLQDELRAKNAELDKLSRIDPLTQLPNRRHFMQCFENEYERSKRYGWPLSYVMSDLDKFKNVNDVYGHLAGDEALVTVSKVLKASLRSHDIAGRYGGEEFALLLPETDTPGAFSVADRCRQCIEATTFKSEEHTLSVTVSMGISTFYPDREGEQPDIKELIRLADDALYKAKEAGRNQVLLAEGE